MAIPEQRLKTWSKLGAQVRSQQTYESIRGALADHQWPWAMGVPRVYLQGSYRNHTNIAGDSDVDVVVETSGVFYSNLTEAEQRLRGFTPGQFTWHEFRDEVFRALVARYSPGRVRQGNKCIQVGGAGDRLNADVVPCCEYRRYGNGYLKGITFWTRSGVQVVNYPELHFDNGTRKSERCNQNYKRMIRVFKNARNEAGSDFPSYFQECLLYNVADRRFAGSHAIMFAGILQDLLDAKANGSMAYWNCQNGIQQVFGTAIHQIDLGVAHRLVDELVALWNNWDG